MRNRFSNENSSEPDSLSMPRMRYPDDVLADENEYCNIKKTAVKDIDKADSSNPR